MITPADIENKEFSIVKKGYSAEEVDEYLDLIIEDMERLIRENRSLKEELEKSNEQVEKHMSTETSVYETLEAAKSLMNDIAASAERRAQVLIKNAELEAETIKKEAKDSVAILTTEGSRLRTRLDSLRARYKQMLELELDRLDFGGKEFMDEFENDFLPETIIAGEVEKKYDESKKPTVIASKEEIKEAVKAEAEAAVQAQEVKSDVKPEPIDLTKTIIRKEL